MNTYIRNEDGTLTEAVPEPYYSDQRPWWLKVLEFPLRLVGIIRYCPLTPWKKKGTPPDWGKE